MRVCFVLPVLLLASCSNLLPNTAPKAHHFKISESGGPYTSDITRFESIGQKSLKRGQKYRIAEIGDRAGPPYYLVVSITQFVGGKKGEVTEGALIYIEDGSADYDCSDWMTDRKISETDEDTPVVSCNFKFIGVLPITERASVQKDQSST